MGDILFGEDETNVDTYGELAGRNELARLFYPMLAQWLPNWERGGEPGYAPLRPVVDLYRTSMPQYHAAGARLQDMLSPDWLTTNAPGLAQMTEAERALMERDVDRTRSELIMKYGSQGQTASSPMVRALADAELGAREAQRAREGQRQFEAYQQKMGLMPGLIQQARGEPYQSAEMIGQRSSDVIEALLNYLNLSKGDTVVTEEHKPGLLEIGADAAATYYGAQAGAA